jgi:transcriptional regulator GlxA family with amidase domain
MRFAFVIYEQMTSLDFIGVFDPLTRLKRMGFLPDVSWDICAHAVEVRDNAGLVLRPNQVGRPLAGYDLVVVPGGNIEVPMRDKAFIDWLRSASASKQIAAVCGGSLLIGLAGFLKDKRATTHPSHYQELKKFCFEVKTDRIVEDGAVVTARGVTASIDLGLYLVEKFAGPEVRAKVQQQMDYLGAPAA